MDVLTRQKLSFILHDAEAVVYNLKAMLEETETESELSAAKMVTALVASTDGKRYMWADRFGVDEITIRRWASGETRPDAKHLSLIREAYGELIDK